MQIRLLALDLDGTLVDPRGALRPATHRAVTAARERGVWIVVCSGRRHRTARPILRALELDGPAILQNGAVVKDAVSGRTLRAEYVPLAAYGTAVEILSRVGPPIVYVDEYAVPEVDMLTATGDGHHPFLREYLRSNRRNTRRVESLARPPSESIVMVSAMADEESLVALESEVRSVLADGSPPCSQQQGVRTNLIMNKGYEGHILEIVSRSAGKWARLAELAAAAGISAAEIMAIGDDANDAEMLARAGIGVAMANAPERVKRIADHVTSANTDDGAARAIEALLLNAPS